jgi:TonB family protein
LFITAIAALLAQDATISPLAWRAPYDAPNELPVLKRKPSLAFPDELKKTSDPGYVIYDLVINAKGQTLALSPHATLAAYERASRGNNETFVWLPGKRDGNGVNTATTFAVIFNPSSAAEKKPDATPRLLEVAAVRVKAPKRAKNTETTPDRVAWADVTVDESGKVTDIKNAPAGLERAFVIAARNWRFAPARKAGVAIAADLRMPFVIVTEGAEEMSSGGKKIPPRVTYQKKPIYPFAMRRSGMRGEVLVDFVVDIEGRVRNPYVVRSLNPSFDDDAIDAVRQWKFEPGMVGERPVPTHMQVPVIFSLDETYGGGHGPMTEEKKGDVSKFPEEFRYDTPPQPRGTVRVVYPYALLRAQKKGKAVVRYIVGTDGRVLRAEVGETSAPEFGLALRAAVECFTFEAALKGGRPCLAMQGYQQEFNRDEIWQLVSDEDIALLRREEKKPETILTLRDLDGPPVALSRRPPRFPVSAKAATGEALIEFLIDEEGRARLPRIVSATEDGFGYAAVQSVASWRFEPPTRGGKTVVVRAQIPITFSPPVKPNDR